MKLDFSTKHETGEREKLIEAIAGLFVSTLRTGPVITPHEIGILYPLLENLFHRHAELSWETYLRRNAEHPPEIGQLLKYLNDRLPEIDKTRLLLSLIVIANSDNDISAGEVTEILELAKSLQLSPDPFVDIMNAMEYGFTSPVRMPGFHFTTQKEESIYGDCLTAGRSALCDIRLHDRKVAETDLLFMFIDRYMFVGTNIHTSATIDSEPLLPNHLYLVPEAAHLHIGSITFTPTQLRRIYQQREIDDVIEMQSGDYFFHILNRNNRFSVIVFQRTLYRNGRLLPLHRETPVYFDDILQIRGFEPFHIMDVIERRAEIGVDNTRPKELFFTFEDNYYHLSRSATARTICTMAVNSDHLVVHSPRKGWEVLVNGNPVEKSARYLLNQDVLSVRKRNFRINTFYELVEVPFEAEQIILQDIKHFFRDGTLALDGISLEAHKGDLIGILGQSGCGKSTLLKCLAGEIIPTYGSVNIDGKDFYRNLNDFTSHFGYVPQEDLLFAELTVYENLWYRGKLQLNRMSSSQLHQKIINILSRTGLAHLRNQRVGNEKAKLLSGGERKRLNIALELLFEPAVLICDEPTSGLSSTDSDNIMLLLKELTQQGKIVITTIHQPNAQTFAAFNQVLLMDRGGKMVFFGTPGETFSYFENEVAQLTVRKERIQRKHQAGSPDFIYEVVNYPEYNQNGEETYIQLNQSLVPKRRFPPNYWRDKYRTRKLFELIHLDEPQVRNTVIRPGRRRSEIDARVHWQMFSGFLFRTFTLKCRNRTNLLLTFGQAPLLGLLIAFILRLAPNVGGYTYHDNVNIGIYLFISVIVFVFLGLSNSIEDILGERRVIIRESLLNLRTGYMLTAKILALSVFAIVQVILYLAVSGLILEIPMGYLPATIYFFLSAGMGFGIGMLASSYITSTKAIINLLPLILIPQIIFGGAVIQFERMNKHLTLIRNDPVPEVVQIIPSRWLFEGVYTAFSKWTPYDRVLVRLDKLQTEYKQGLIRERAFEEERERLRGVLEERIRQYPTLKYDNTDLDFTVDFMDGRFFLTGQNVFLSSYKIVGSLQVRTFFFNIIVIMAYLILLNGITYVRIKYFYKDR
jgi:ABC-type multidrug transport system ATPase subunit